VRRSGHIGWDLDSIGEKQRSQRSGRGDATLAKERAEFVQALADAKLVIW